MIGPTYCFLRVTESGYFFPGSAILLRAAGVTRVSATLEIEVSMVLVTMKNDAVTQD